MSEFLEIIFGQLSAAYVAGMMVWAGIGFVIYNFLEVNERDVLGEKTPKKFKWGFYLIDNWKRIIGTILLVFVQFRFFEQLSGGQELTPYVALVMGMSSDAISSFGKKSTTFMQADRKKLLETYGEHDDE